MSAPPTAPRPRRRLRTPAAAAGAVAAVAVLVATSGCGLINAKSSDDASPQAAATSEPPRQTPTGEATASAEPAAALGEPVASRTGSADEAELELDLYPVVRSGKLAELNFAITLVRSTNDKLQVADLLSDGNYDSVDSGGHSADGVQLLDTVNSKLHLPASDGLGHCLCSRDLSATFIGLGKTMVFSATYAAPPANVDTVDVQVPHFGTITDVPVQ